MAETVVERWPRPHRVAPSPQSRRPRPTARRPRRRHRATLDIAPRREPDGRAVVGEHPSRRTDRGAGRLTRVQQPGQQLQHHLRLRVAAHRPEHGAPRAVGTGHRARATTSRVGGGPARTPPGDPARARSRCRGCAGRCRCGARRDGRRSRQRSTGSATLPCRWRRPRTDRWCRPPRAASGSIATRSRIDGRHARREPIGCEQRCRVARLGEHVVAVVADLPRRLDEQVRPQLVTRIRRAGRDARRSTRRPR